MVYNQEYYQANKERINQRKRELWANRDNTKRIKQINEKGKESQAKYRRSPKGKKVLMIADWKYNGVIHPNFNELYEYYISRIFCESCDTPFDDDRKLNRWKCLDHDHSNGQFRKVICNKCNSMDAYLN